MVRFHESSARMPRRVVTGYQNWLAALQGSFWRILGVREVTEIISQEILVADVAPTTRRAIGFASP